MGPPRSQEHGPGSLAGLVGPCFHGRRFIAHAGVSSLLEAHSATSRPGTAAFDPLRCDLTDCHVAAPYTRPPCKVRCRCEGPTRGDMRAVRCSPSAPPGTALRVRDLADRTGLPQPSLDRSCWPSRSRTVRSSEGLRRYCTHVPGNHPRPERLGGPDRSGGASAPHTDAPFPRCHCVLLASGRRGAADASLLETNTSTTSPRSPRNLPGRRGPHH